MFKGESDIDRAILDRLTPQERESGIAYVSSATYESGHALAFPQMSIEVPWKARLVFVDAEPTANWGHSCRYLLIEEATGKTLSFEARFPPIRRQESHDWRVSFRADGVPDAVLLV